MYKCIWEARAVLSLCECGQQARYKEEVEKAEPIRHVSEKDKDLG